MFSGPHRVELRDHDVLKTFAARFSTQVERYEALHRHLDGAELPLGWRARVPALTNINSGSCSIVMTRAPGASIYHAIERGQEVPWEAIGAALGHLHAGRARSEGARYVHGDAAPNNIMFCPEAREIWLIDPEVEATSSPWQDLFCLLWVIFRRSWGLAAAVELLRGWQGASGLTWTRNDMELGWQETLRTHLAGQTSHLWARRALRWGFRQMWVPLALGLSRR